MQKHHSLITPITHALNSKQHPKKSSMASGSTNGSQFAVGIPRPGIRSRLSRSVSPGGSGASWQANLDPAGGVRRNPAGLVIPRARVSHRSGGSGGGYSNQGFHSDDECLSPVEVSFSVSFLHHVIVN